MRVSVCFENWTTEIQVRPVYQAWEAWMWMLQYYGNKISAFKSGRRVDIQGVAARFGGTGDVEYRTSSMMWADNQWIFSEDMEKLRGMMNGINDDLMDMDMESLW